MRQRFISMPVVRLSSGTVTWDVGTRVALAGAKALSGQRAGVLYKNAARLPAPRAKKVRWQ